ncbi:daunorubicin resistance ABC transporter ATPase subunit [Ketogulonicigenium robustum]|uniref:Daunorubicin resistance ABC transporter ATPase subunit n=1 Tax=Ketogulonicigenium robustum TaxID=92947 RepID=A0A1W6NYC4_9RHOB|nr:ABC transporter ATP-binding protein [Ketogulonicigenium robustum]ARO14245.1 daunorubicin resistance ABC transporter ATPase subunit [Ketogulonicigenium robustum]
MTGRSQLFTLDAVTVEFGRNVALDRVSLQIAQGEWFSILGRNGAGKSTLIKVLASLLRPDFGKAFFHFQGKMRPVGRARQHLGFVPQSGSLDARLSVLENLLFAAALQGLRGPRRKAAIDAALTQFEPLADRIVGTLSTGQKRRVEVARALLHEPAVLILDEATAGIDAHSRQQIWDQIAARRNAQNVSVIMTSHFIEEVAQSERACIMHGGKLHGIWQTDALLDKFGGQHYRITPTDSAARAALLVALHDATLDAATGDVLLTTTSAAPADLAAIARYGAKVAAGRAPLERAIISATEGVNPGVSA